MCHKKHLFKCISNNKIDKKEQSDINIIKKGLKIEKMGFDC